MSQFTNRLPGMGGSMSLTPRTLFIMNTTTTADFLPGGKYIDGFATRDPDNTIRTDEIRPGLLLGLIANSGTASGGTTAATVGMLGAAVIGTLTAAITAATTVTAITLSLVAAKEIVRRVGTSGTLVITGAPTAGGVVATASMVFSAVATATGILTITTLSTAFVAGSWIGANDGTATPTTFYPGQYPKRVTDFLDADMGVPLELDFVGNAIVNTVNIVNYPPAANTTQITYLKTKLRVPVPGMKFSDDF